MEQNNLHLPTIEKNILGFWQREDIFAKTVAGRKGATPFVFYDGPPFVTGLPHYGHILQMALKDAVLRYKTMQGFNVPRKIGWDTHGLPVEYQLEKELGISGKREIENYGIEKFVAAARQIVLRYSSEWKTTMERMGRWVDISNPYTTMDNTYIESVWWAFKSLYDKNLVYQDYRVSPYCPRCGTVLSNFEVNQGYQDDTLDVSVYVTLPLKDSDSDLDGANLLIWTTTPWTLPANVAVAVDPKLAYVLVEHEGKKYVIGQKSAQTLFPHAAILQTFTGEQLMGLHYEPLYPTAKKGDVYRVVAGHHVTDEEGTGLVHMAPAYGEDDFVIGRQENLPIVQTIESDGKVSQGKCLPGERLFFKTADKEIIADLQQRDLLLKEEKITHTYPFCWRCSTPLLYYPATSWFVKVTDPELKLSLIAENKKIKWQPKHLRDGRFGRWLEGARDWAISRDRFWGAPLPVWHCNECKAIEVIGSLEQLHAKGDFDLKDLHRPFIDTVKFSCDHCQRGQMVRVPFVFDCWFESGSMPYAQDHYPFENQDNFNPATNTGYPAEFIAEALDQTRGWFYTLHVLGVALFGQRAYDNVVTSGLVLAPDGKKLSKSLRNYTDPEIIMEEQGVDALRLFLFTATTLGEDYRFSDAAVQDVKRRWIVPLLNVLQYYHLSVEDKDDSVATESQYTLLDGWIKSRVAAAGTQIARAMEGEGDESSYNLTNACRTFGPLVEDLSTWYIRLSRGRRDVAFTDTLRHVLIAIGSLYAPFMPFVAEHIYQSVRGGDETQSIHMRDYPILHEWANAELLNAMETIRAVVSLGRELRAKVGIPLRQPLSKLEIAGMDDQWKTAGQLLALVSAELQIGVVTLARNRAFTPGYAITEGGGLSIALDTTIYDYLRYQGEANLLRRIIQDLRKQANLQPRDQAQVYVSHLSPEVSQALQEQLATTKLITEAPGPSTVAEITHTIADQSIDIKLYPLRDVSSS